MNPPIVSYGLLAIELIPGQTLQRPTLAVAEAEMLGQHLVKDLQPWLAGHGGIDLALVGATYDPVELLRPGWPLHAEIAHLLHTAPPMPEARVLCLGAHQERLPQALQPQAEYAEGPLRWLPFVLRGPADSMQAITPHLEAELLERGMAGAATALFAQSAFATAIEHARYMTLNDGLAMMAMQYQHSGLAPVWPVIETALLSPTRSAWIDQAPEPLLYFAEGTAHLALLDCHQWARMQTDAASQSAEQLERRFQQFQMRQRQIAALLQAHGIAVEFDFCADADTARDVLQA